MKPSFVDLARLIDTPKCAIFFNTVEEVKQFWHNCEEQLADFCGFWELGDVVRRWENNPTIGFTFMTDTMPESMTWCDRAWYEASGYEIIEFADLVNPVEIEESEMSLNILLSQDSASTPS